MEDPSGGPSCRSNSCFASTTIRKTRIMSTPEFLFTNLSKYNWNGTQKLIHSITLDDQIKFGGQTYTHFAYVTHEDGINNQTPGSYTLFLIRANEIIKYDFHNHKGTVSKLTTNIKVDFCFCIYKLQRNA